MAEGVNLFGSGPDQKVVDGGGVSYEGYSGPPTPFDPYPGTGEISEDPLFVDPA
ncbi:MAG: hypothetical protein ACE5OP_13990 [Candidatus Glassbacteria bacterium]